MPLFCALLSLEGDALEGYNAKKPSREEAPLVSPTGLERAVLAGVGRDEGQAEAGLRQKEIRVSMLVKVSDGLLKIRKSLGSNIYLITDDGLTLVDAGFPIDLPNIHLALRSLGAGPRDLDLIVATHYHGDHVGTVAGLKRRYGVRVAVHEEDSLFTCGDRRYETYEIQVSRLIFYTALWPLFRYRPFQADRTLKEGDVLDPLGGLEVIHTPGHTVGSICLYSEERGILFSGDLLRNEKGVLEGPPPQYTPDPTAACRSLERIAAFDFETLLPGHGEVILKGAGDRFRALLGEGMIWPLCDNGAVS